MELFGDWNPWMEEIISLCARTEEHTFIFLTKQPQNLSKFSPFPSNVCVGVSATDDVMFTKAWKFLKPIRAKVKFISFEPLLNWGMSQADTESSLVGAGIKWVIIGQQTPISESTKPSIEWVRNIIEANDLIFNPVFLKNNLKSLMGDDMRQEFPK